MSSNKCLDVGGGSTQSGAPIIQWDCHGGANQAWDLRDVGGSVNVVSKHSGKCLALEQDSQNDLTRLVQKDCGGGEAQRWLIRR